VPYGWYHSLPRRGGRELAQCSTRPPRVRLELLARALSAYGVCNRSGTPARKGCLHNSFSRSTPSRGKYDPLLTRSSLFLLYSLSDGVLFWRFSKPRRSRLCSCDLARVYIRISALSISLFDGKSFAPATLCCFWSFWVSGGWIFFTEPVWFELPCVMCGWQVGRICWKLGILGSAAHSID
jgi:hypothetical protein